MTEQGFAQLYLLEPSRYDVGYQVGEATLKEELEIESAREQNSYEQVVFANSYRCREASPPATVGFNNWMKRLVDEEELAVYLVWPSGQEPQGLQTARLRWLFTSFSFIY